MLDNLKEIRVKISNIDDQLLTLLSERRKLSQSVAEEKKHINKPLRDQQREKELLEALIAKASSIGLDSHYITQIFNSIIEDSVKFQQDYLQATIHPEIKNSDKKDIAILGGKGAYSYLAAKKYFNKSKNEYLACSSFEEVLNSVENSNASYGVIPIENTTSGGITEVYDLLLDSSLTIIGEEKFPINHCLVAPKESKLKDIQSIVSHPQASRQCNKSLKRITSATIKLVSSTAHALEHITQQGKTDTAAIASEQAADLFGMKVLAHNIANQSENITRFLILSKKPVEVSLAVQCKTSLALSTGQKAGSLSEVLSLFQQADIPLSKLESRPIPNKPWEQIFYIDLEGNIREEKVKNALNSISKICLFLRIFGSYPTQDIVATQVSPLSLAKAKINSMRQLEITNSSESKKTKQEEAGNYFLTSREHKNEDTIVKVKNIEISKNNFAVFGGTSTKEDFEQLVSDLKHANETGVSIFYSHTSKPDPSARANQNSQKNHLDLIKQANNKYQMPLLLQVTNTDEVKIISEYADIIEIESNNMQNYSLLEAVGKVNCPVMLRRSFTASIADFLNAAETILSQGNLQVILCEGGSKQFEDEGRNYLDLSNLLVLRQLTHLPIVVDSSFSVNSNELLLPLTKAVQAAGAQGVIVEFEATPEKTTKSSQQQLDYTLFATMMKQLYKK